MIRRDDEERENANEGGEARKDVEDRSPAFRGVLGDAMDRAE